MTKSERASMEELREANKRMAEQVKKLNEKIQKLVLEVKECRDARTT